MVLPTQRGTGSAVLRTMITRYFSYWDTDESGELSMKELGELLLRFVNVEREMVPDEVLRGLLRRYDVNGDGTVTFDEIAETKPFIEEWYAALNQLALTDAQKEAIVDEGNLVFALNIDQTLADLLT